MTEIVPLAMQHEDSETGLVAGGRPIKSNLNPAADSDTPTRGFVPSPDSVAGQSAYEIEIPVNRQDSFTQEVTRD